MPMQPRTADALFRGSLRWAAGTLFPPLPAPPEPEAVDGGPRSWEAYLAARFPGVGEKTQQAVAQDALSFPLTVGQ